jgi:hypothetical protein
VLGLTTVYTDTAVPFVPAVPGFATSPAETTIPIMYRQDTQSIHAAKESPYHGLTMAYAVSTSVPLERLLFRKVARHP